ncbi:putative FBD-associated F-box protein At5g38570 [Raphanus sativus]|uniref:FBD-associated F-box protein At5g38570 n=1 Tax=Raphanus sativus TaxID=3726 RepID=A0A9W3BTX6_RAPSA|nr:putative FBD-associated F-box protein At5g38570 [Raphanus sativus]
MLTICSQTMLDEGFVFNQLEHLDLCLCPSLFPGQLVRLLKASPKLKRLDIFLTDHHSPRVMDEWNQPSTVPECLLSSLQSLWSEYTGEPKEREIVVYILKHAVHLETARIKSSSESAVQKFEMLKELSRSSRASTTCEFVGDGL